MVDFDNFSGCFNQFRRDDSGLETKSNQQPEKIVDADKNLTVDSNHALIINSKD